MWSDQKPPETRRADTQHFNLIVSVSAQHPGIQRVLRSSGLIFSVFDYEFAEKVSSFKNVLPHYSLSTQSNLYLQSNW